MDNGSGLDKRLNALKYTKDDINNIRFLISLKDFTSDLVANYKRNQNKTTLSDSQIVEFGKLIGKNMNRFVNFKLTVRGNEVPSHIRGAGVSDWINKKEADNYINQA
jgi:hypothetical protein